MKEIKVFKFGGASLRDAEQIKRTLDILKLYPNEKIVLIVSAMGKTTNKLESVVNDFYTNNDNALQHFLEIKQNHLLVATELGITDQEALVDIEDTFVEGIWLLEDEPNDTYDYIYDQIVSLGELVCSKIIYYYSLNQNYSIDLIDARDIIKTDDYHRSANINWKATSNAINHDLKNRVGMYDIILTQGFIGSTFDNNNTTLGREGSDFSAAVISNCLNAESLTVWKDVEGIMSSDPYIDKSATKINKLDYFEMIEMCYFGAKVLHPKTIKPLQNKNIPLYVRSFIDLQSPGTVIGNFGAMSYPEIKIVENNQCLVKISPRDFSFVSENHLKIIFAILDELKIKVFVMRNTALHFLFSTNYESNKLDKFNELLNNEFDIAIEKDLRLITIRHEENAFYNKDGKEVIFEEKFDKTRHLLFKNED